jgi:hypothetical protein
MLDCDFLNLLVNPIFRKDLVIHIGMCQRNVKIRYFVTILTKSALLSLKLALNGGITRQIPQTPAKTTPFQQQSHSAW